MGRNSRKKPTMKETVQVINQMIREITSLKADVQTMTGVVYMYIEMNNDTEKFNKFVNSKLKVEGNNDVRTNEEGSTVSAEGGP